MYMRNVMMMGLITVLSVGILWSSEAADQHDRMAMNWDGPPL